MKEYIRRRRLAVAASMLLNTRHTVFEIALSLRYKSYEGFSRAFKSELFISPDEYRKNPTELAACQPLDVFNEYGFEQPLDLDFDLELSSSYLPEMLITEFEISTTLDQNKHQVDICNFASDCFQNKCLDKIFDLSQTEIFGVYTNMTSQDDFNYTIGGLKNACRQLDDAMSTHRLPASHYAKFILNRNDRIKEAWHYIYGLWFPKIKALRSFGYDFEVYQDHQTIIYIPMSKVPGSMTC